MKRKILDALIAWKESRDRKPLILDGARQVGKTWSIKEFGKRAYSAFAYVNLEIDASVADFFSSDIDPGRLLRFLETYTNQRILPGKTLVILDEIQSCERALNSLKYFNEQAPDFHVAAAGSLLGVAINRERFSFPVGKVDTRTMRPLDFEEFLWACGQDGTAETIRTCFENDGAMPQAIHDRALELYRTYLVVGGMPACIKSFVESGSILEIPSIQNQITNDYIADMAKYATHTESVKIRAAFNSIPSQLAKDNKKFQYKIVQRGGTAAIFGASIEWLNFAGIVLKCRKIEHGTIPLAVHEDAGSFKLYMGDTGLLTMKAGMPPQAILSPMVLDSGFSGALAENYVAQCLTAKNMPLYYWESKSIAEVDFLLQKGTEVIPIEVKAGLHTRSRSLNRFMQLYQPPYGIRLSTRNFGFENLIKSVPLYAAFCL